MAQRTRYRLLFLTDYAHMGIGLALSGPDVRALQLVWTDAFGRWPWRRDFARGRGGQPVLGVRTPQND